TNGEVMVAADSAYIEYRLASFLGGDIVINDLVLYHPDVLLYRTPGDSVWNYQAVLQDTPQAPPDSGRARPTLLHALRMVDGEVTIRLPWEPADDVSDAERQQEIEEALADESRLAVESVPGGYLRTIVARVTDATLEALTIVADERGGTYLRVVDAVAE